MRKPVHRNKCGGSWVEHMNHWNLLQVCKMFSKPWSADLSKNPRSYALFQRVITWYLGTNCFQNHEILPWRWKQQINTSVISSSLTAACVVWIVYTVFKYLCNVNQGTNVDNKCYVLVLNAYQTTFTASHSKICFTYRLTKILLNGNKERGTGFSAWTDLIKESLETVPAMAVFMGLNDRRTGTWVLAGKEVLFSLLHLFQGWPNQEYWYVQSMWNVWKAGEVHTEFG